MLGSAETTCSLLKCCMEDCCGQDTAWEPTISSCIPSTGSPGFNGTYRFNPNPRECQVQMCCEETCCDTGTYFDADLGCCLALESTPAPTAAPTNSYCGCPDSLPQFFCNFTFPSSPLARCGRCENESCQFDPSPPGLCEEIPQQCPDYEYLVCGCDNIEYRNWCFANMQGVSIQHIGPCKQDCTLENFECDTKDFYCNFVNEDCGLTPGVCQEQAFFYDCIFTPPDPVCGCDGETYENACYAAEARVSIQHQGEC